MVEEIVKQAGSVSRALAVAGDNDGAALIIVDEVILKSGFYVNVSEVERSLTVGSLRIEERIERGLAVARGLDATSCVENAGLMSEGAFVGEAVELVLAQVRVPGGGTVVSSGVNEENVGVGSGLLVAQTRFVGHGIGRVAAGWQSGPAAIEGVVGAGGGGVGSESAARFEQAETGAEGQQTQ